MDKSDYFTEDLMTKYKMRLNADKEWDSTLNHFSKLFVQCKYTATTALSIADLRAPSPCSTSPPTTPLRCLRATAISPHVTSTSKASRSH